MFLAALAGESLFDIVNLNVAYEYLARRVVDEYPQAAAKGDAIRCGFVCGGEVGIQFGFEFEDRAGEIYRPVIASGGFAPSLQRPQRFAVALLPQPPGRAAVQVPFEAVAAARGGVLVYEEVIGSEGADEVVGYGVVAAVLRQAQLPLRLAEGSAQEVVAGERVVVDGAALGAPARLVEIASHIDTRAAT